MLLSQLSNGSHALVTRVLSGSAEVGEATLRRLGELGFIAGESVQMLRRGPGAVSYTHLTLPTNREV